MRVTFHEAKRARTLAERSLDFAHAPEVFSGPKFEIVDDRFDYGEERWLTVGWLDGVMVVVVWTLRGDARHVISMRRCNAREERKYGKRMG